MRGPDFWAKYGLPCLWLVMLMASWILFLPGPVLAQDASLETSCRNGNAQACLERGQALERNKATRRQAASVFKMACDLDSAKGCQKYAGELIRDVASRRRPPSVQGEAYSAYAKSCRLGLAHSCYMQGLMAKNGQGTTASAEIARTAYIRACELDPKNKRACEAAGNPIQLAVPRVSKPKYTGPAADKDRKCRETYYKIQDLMNYRYRSPTDAEISWALKYETAAREGAPCPSNRPDVFWTDNPVQAPKAIVDVYDHGDKGQRRCWKSGGEGRQRWHRDPRTGRKVYGLCVVLAKYN